jgi:hypothetical protein
VLCVLINSLTIIYSEPKTSSRRRHSQAAGHSEHKHRKTVATELTVLKTEDRYTKTMQLINASFM